MIHTSYRASFATLQLSGVGAVVACDLDEVAVEAMRKNIEINGEEAKKLHTIHGDARLHMLQHPCVRLFIRVIVLLANPWLLI